MNVNDTRFFDEDWNEYDLDLDIGDHSAQIQAKSETCQTNISPLVDSIANGTAVVYVGAGASLAAGLPNWRSFLLILCHEVRKYSTHAAGRIEERINRGEFLVAAEMIQNILENELQNVTHRECGRVSIPTSIHRAIASIPFSLAVTTNYDCLLENAYSSSIPRLTWQNPLDVLQNLKSGIFCVLKLHGDYAIRDSVVLASSHYRKLMHGNRAILDCMKMLITTRTFLFVGVSFSDPDLLALFDEAHSMYGNIVGPHFAIVPEKYFVPEHSEVLKKSYNIHTLIARNHGDADPTKGVSSLLSNVGGLAARVGVTTRGIPSKSPGMQQFPLQVQCERTQIRLLLEELSNRLGVHYADVCLTKPGDPERRLLYRAYQFRVKDQKATFNDYPNGPVKNDAIQARFFLQRKIDRDFVLLNDIESQGDTLQRQGFPGVNYIPALHTARTALCVPIYVDGKRSGVLTVESEYPNAISKHHHVALKKFASYIGAARNEANRVLDSSSRLRKYSSSAQAFNSNLQLSRVLKESAVESLLYEIDPHRGRLVAGLRSNQESERARSQYGTDQWEYQFDEQSLASEAFRERRTVRVPDVLQDRRILSERGTRFFDIRGPICAFPIHVRGYTAGVFVGWSSICERVHESSNQNLPIRLNKDVPKWRKSFWRAMERARRILHVLANEPRSQDVGILQGRGQKFLNDIRIAITPIDEEKPWKERMEKAEFRTDIINALLGVLVESSTGLKRVRLFAVEKEKGRFQTRCVASRCSKEACRPNSSPVNQYAGEKIEDPDPYITYTMNRARFDPYCRIQDEVSLGDLPDPSVSLFDKVRGRPWLVVPVGQQRFDDISGERYGMNCSGFLSGDQFVWDPNLNTMVDPISATPRELETNEEFVFQRYCLDLIADVLGVLLGFEKRKVMS